MGLRVMNSQALFYVKMWKFIMWKLERLLDELRDVMGRWKILTMGIVWWEENTAHISYELFLRNFIAI